MRASLDGGVPPPKGTLLPTGSHTYEVSFSKCDLGWGGEIGLNGFASAAYNAATWSNVVGLPQVTATVTADSMRAYGLEAYHEGLLEVADVTADGSGVWTSGTTTTYTPATGSRLVNNSTGNVATFGGGSYSSGWRSGGKMEWRFDNLRVAINGTDYTLTGTHDRTSQPNGPFTYTGEIRITSNGTLVARIYGDARSARVIEVLAPLVPF